ncbi:MAG TPA: hypothetical protein P5514_10075 [Bacteroidales bacterium]|nr:hypothetical protein [Bacteroidales bacterium]HRX97280.1 hypothetical protein [Bacteroidales bacterium]
MKKILNISLAIFVLLVFFKSHCSGQGLDTISSKKQFVIKGFSHVIPQIPFSVFSISVSLGIEKQLPNGKYLTLSGFYWFTENENGNQTNFYSLKSGYRKYYNEAKIKGPIFWTELYLTYIFSVASWDVNEKFERDSFYGLGYAGGIRVFLSKKRKWFFDTGLGVSANLIDHKNGYLGDHNISVTPLPRPIIQLGCKF